MSFCEKMLGTIGKTIDKGFSAGKKAKIVRKSRAGIAKVLDTTGKIIKPTEEKIEEEKTND